MAWQHGTAAGYQDRLCRCDECKAWNTAWHRRRRRERYAEDIPDSVEHGLKSTYINWWCRCWKCSTANYVHSTLMRQGYRAKTKTLRPTHHTDRVRGSTSK